MSQFGSGMAIISSHCILPARLVSKVCVMESGDSPWTIKDLNTDLPTIPKPLLDPSMFHTCHFEPSLFLLGLIMLYSENWVSIHCP